MAVIRTRHEVQVGAVRALLSSPTGGVARDMYRRGQRVRSRAIELVGADTGRLRTSIHVELVVRGELVIARVGSDVEYALPQEEGHGVIVPVRARVLVFRPRGSGRLVFTRQVRAVEGTHYLKRALPAARG
jgi:hypothetical protein